MRTGWIGALAGAVALALAGCAEDEPPAPPPVAAAVEPTREVVARVSTLELGRTRTGFMLTAHGEADGQGWRLAQLRPVAPVAGQDGFLEFEFVAFPPVAAAGGAQILRADTPLGPEQLRGARGVRVVARSGQIEGRL